MKKTQAMSADEALAFAVTWSQDSVNHAVMVAAVLAAEVRSLREQNRRLRPSAPAFDMKAAAKAAIVGSCPPDESFLEHDEYVRNVLTAALPHLPVYREFGADGKPFCRRSWNDGRRAGIESANEFRDLIDPGMEALRRERDELREALQNMMGAFDTPIRRLKFPNSFGDEACLIGRSTLDTTQDPSHERA